ncbi:hypothetical protein Tco_0116864 [Tanacetum coccineum]
MDLLAFIRTADPTKVRVGERQCGEDEPKLLDTTVGRTVPLLPVAPARAQSELDANVDSEVAEVVAEDEIPLRSRQRKRKTIVDAGEPSHPAKKLRDDHGAPGGPFVAGKSRSAVQRLVAGAVLNAEVRGGPVLTLPFVTSSVSATTEREDEHPADSVTGLNLRTICASQRFVISSDSSHHSGANIAEAEVDSIARSSAPIIATVVTATADVATTTKAAPAKPSLFAVGSSSAGGTDPVPGGFSDVSGSDFLVGGIHTVVDREFNLQKVYVPQWSVTNGSCLDDGRVCREMLDEFAPPKFFASIRGMEHDQLFTEFNVGAARQISLSAEVGMRAEYNIKEKRRLKVVVEEKDILLKTKGEAIDSLNAQLLLKETEATKAIHLRAEASRFEIVADLAATVKVREQEAADSDALVIAVILQNDSLADQLEASSAGLQEKVNILYAPFEAIAGRRWLLDSTVLELARYLKCLNSTDYLSALGGNGKAVGKRPCKEGFIAVLLTALRVQKIKENLANRVSALCDVFIPLSGPLSVTALTGTEGTSAVVAIPAGTTTTLSVTFSSTSIFRPISTDDYEIVHVDGQRGGSTEDQIGGDNVDPFPSVDNVDLNLQ